MAVLFCCNFSWYIYMIYTWPRTPYALVWSRSGYSPVLIISWSRLLRSWLPTLDTLCYKKKVSQVTGFRMEPAVWLTAAVYSARLPSPLLLPGPSPYPSPCALLPLPPLLLNAALNAGLHFLLRLWSCWTCCFFPFFFFCNRSSSHEVCQLVCVRVCARVLVCVCEGLAASKLTTATISFCFPWHKKVVPLSSLSSLLFFFLFFVLVSDGAEK